MVLECACDIVLETVSDVTFDGVKVEQDLGDDDTSVNEDKHTQCDLEGTAVQQASRAFPTAASPTHHFYKSLITEICALLYKTLNLHTQHGRGTVCVCFYNMLIYGILIFCSMQMYAEIFVHMHLHLNGAYRYCYARKTTFF